MKKLLLLKIIILITVIIILYCGCSSYKYKYKCVEKFTITEVSSTLQNILDEQRDLKQDQTKILEKLDYISNYKKINNPHIDNKLNEYNNIVNKDDIINELSNLNLSNLYETEIDEMENSDDNPSTDDLYKYINVLKTKFLIDNEIITSKIEDEVYEGKQFTPSVLKYPLNTNDLYYREQIMPTIYESLGSGASQIQFSMKLTEIENDQKKQPEIYIKNEDGEIDRNPDNQIYFNDKTKFNQDLEEFEIEEENFEIVREKTKNDMENGIFLGSGSGDSYFISRDEYKNLFD